MFYYIDTKKKTEKSGLQFETIYQELIKRERDSLFN